MTLSDVVPLPSCPCLLSPQHSTAPSVRRPQLKPFPAAMVLNRWPPATAVGAARSLPSGSPSSPYRLLPQQYAVPSVPTPHVCVQPAATLRNVPRPATRTASARSDFVRSPSCPRLFCPQQEI